MTDDGHFEDVPILAKVTKLVNRLNAGWVLVPQSAGELPRALQEGHSGMDITYFARGLAIGFAIAAPVGAIGLLCIRRTLADGRLAGFVSGLGAATADAIYGAIAALGLTAISSAIVAHQSAVRLVGGVFLCYLGARTALSHPGLAANAGAARGLVAAFASTLALTLTNPTTVLSFAAVFAGLGLGTTARDRGSAILKVCGVFLGSALWWLLLSGAVEFFRGALTQERLRRVNQLSGAVLAGLGVLSLLSLAP
jgi:threonine/homoserine/homoserine lactone efflux protein